jgi:hypothetical protein
MRMRDYLYVGLIAAGMGLASVANAAVNLVTSDAGYTGPTLNLGAFSNGSYNFTFGPVALPGGITFTAAPGGGGNSGQGSVIGQGGYGLASNGGFGLPSTYIGVDSGTGFATLSFASPVSSFGAYFNYAPGFGDPPTISAFGAGNTLLGAFDLSALAPISTPGGFNQFAFRGIVSDGTDITSFQFGGSYILLAGSPNGVVPGVPEPATWAMMLIGFAGLGLALRRKQRVATAA